MDITAFVAGKREALLIADHATYRAQLSRQIHASRKRLGRATPKREKFARKPLTADDVKKDVAFAHLQIMIAERAWAHAMHIKSSHAEDEKGITGSARAQIISKLWKAAKTAGELVEVLREVGGKERDLLEARTYAAMLAGAEEFEKQAEGVQKEGGEERWSKCLKRWSEARVGYAALLEKERAEVFREMLANTVDPTIRYAAYQARLSRTIAIEVVAKRYFPKDDKEAVRLVEAEDAYALKEKPKAETGDEKKAETLEVPDFVTWRGRRANIVDASIGQALASVAAAEAKLKTYLAEHPSASAGQKAAAYDDILIASQDAADAAKRATDELEKERVDEGDARMQDLRVTSLAVNYDLVSWRVGRNRILIGDNDGLEFKAKLQAKPRPRSDGTEFPDKEESRGRQLARLRERIVLYDATIQSVESIKDLRGAMRDETFVLELDGKSAYFRAIKCINIAYSHTLLDNHLNALALYKRAQDLITANPAPASTAPASTPPTLDISSTSSTALTTQVNNLVSRTHALVEMHKLSSNSAIAAQKNMTSAAPAVQNLGAYPTPGLQVDLNNLVSYPPKIQPVPVKPLFLDVAWNYIHYPGHEAAPAVAVPPAAAEEVNGQMDVDNEPAPAPEKKRGWFGFGR